MKRLMLAVCAMLVFVACSPTPASSKAFDSRDPNIIRAEGIIQGTSETTFVAMAGFERRFLAWFAKNSENPEDSEMVRVLSEYHTRLLALSVHLIDLQIDTADAKKFDLTPEHPKIRKMYDLIAEANKPMFAMMQIVIRAEEARVAKPK